MVGEALADIVRSPDGTRRVHPGGSPANVALGLARLGREVRLLTHLGSDAYGHLVRRHLESSGVRLVRGSVDDKPTSTATATLDAAGEAEYDFDLRWALPAVPLPPDCLALHTGSIAAVLEPGASTVERLVREAAGRSTICFDPNARPALMGSPDVARRRIEGWVAVADVVKVSDEDLAWLVPGEEPASVAARWLDLGPSLVVVTRGGDGAFGLAASGRADVPALSVEVVDTVGAGDAFTSGLLDALWTAGLLGGDRRSGLRAIGRPVLADVLTRAAAVAAVTVSRAGAEPPTQEELSAGLATA